MKRTFVDQVMGLPVSVLLRGTLPEDAATSVRRLFEELHQVDARFSTYREDSEVSLLNRGELVAASDELRLVARLCDQARDETQGCFDARRPDGSWDPSGLVKGWAVERASRHLADLPLDWCVNAGGDVLARSVTGEPFGVGIADPFDPSAVLAVVPLVAGAVATSGTAARGQHLWDSRTGAVAGDRVSVTVTGSSLTRADVLATAAFVGGLGVAGDAAALAVHADGGLERTAAWEAQQPAAALR